MEIHCNPIPYVGVAGVTTHAQASAIARLSRSGRPTMCGVLASPATLGGRPSPHFPRRYPAREEIRGIFPDDDHALNCVHLCGWERERLVERLLEVEDLAGPRLDAIQLNCSRWPDVIALAKWRTSRRGRRPLLILQVSASMMRAASDCPEQIARRAAEYGRLADHLLLDGSGGKGTVPTVRWTMELIAALRQEAALGSVGIGFAGGIAAGHMGHVRGVFANAGPCISIDMESQVRHATTDELDLELALESVREAYAIVDEQARRAERARRGCAVAPTVAWA